MTYEEIQSSFEKMLEQEEELRYEEASLKEKTKAELKDICEKLGLDTDGNKAQLRKRIMDNNPEVLDIGNKGVTFTKENEDDNTDSRAGAKGNRV